MSSPTASLFVAVKNDIAYVRIVGRANFACGVDFKALMEGLVARGHKRLALDFQECPIMDSTFIGLLTGFGMQLPPLDGQGISLHHMNERVSGLLVNLGVGQLFLNCSNANGIPANLESTEAQSAKHDHAEMQRTCLEAHRTLMEANPDNVARFKDVTRFLEEDLKKTEGMGPT